MDEPAQHPSFRLKCWLKFVSVGGVASLGVSAVLFQIANIYDKRVIELYKAHALETIASASRLDAMLPLIVAVRGRLTSPEPSRCELSSSPAVMRELLEEEVYFKEHSSGRVTQECFEIRREQEQREAFVEDRTASIKLDHLQHAEGLTGVMEVKQVFHPADLMKGPLIRHFINKAFKSMVKHGCRITERYLPVDSTVTIIGELVPDWVGSGAGRKQPLAAGAGPSSTHTSTARPDAAAASSHPGWAGEDSGVQARRSSNADAGTSGRFEAGGQEGTGAATAAASAAVAAVGVEVLGQAAAAAGQAVVAALPYTLRKPAHGPMYVTSLTLPHLRVSMERTSRTLRAFAWGFGLLGAALVARRIVTKLLRDREQRRLKRLLAEAEAARRQRLAARAAAGGGEAAGGQAAPGCTGDDYERGPGVCVVCLDRDTDVVFSGCGHMCTCVSCTESLQGGKCPICRVHSRPIRVFRP